MSAKEEELPKIPEAGSKSAQDQAHTDENG